MDIRQAFTAPSSSSRDRSGSPDSTQAGVSDTASQATAQQPADPSKPDSRPFEPRSQRNEPQDSPPRQTSRSEARRTPTERRAPQQSPAEQYFGQMVQPDPEITVFSWIAASRPFKNHHRKYYTTIGVIVLLISLILFFAGQFLPVAVVLAVAFVSYVMSTIPPEMITNKITTYGLRLDENLYYWDELGTFWFEKKLAKDVLILETVQFPYRVMFVLDNTSVEEIRDILARVLIEKKPPLTSYEKAGKWLQDKFPLDIDGDDDEKPATKSADMRSASVAPPTTQPTTAQEAPAGSPPNNTPHPQ